MDSAQLQHMFRPPESPREPMKFLSRSWSISALEFSKALAPPLLPPPPSQLLPKTNPENAGSGSGDIIIDDIAAELEAAAATASATVSGNTFTFASSETSQVIMERIMSQSQEVSPRTSGRVSHSSGTLNGSSVSDSPPVSPSEMDDPKYCHSTDPIASNQYKSFVTSGAGKKMVGRWLKDRKEKKKEEVRAQNAQLHAAVSVAGVAAAIAAIASATAASSRARNDEQMAKTDMAVASAATLVAAQCVEAAEAMGAEHDHLASMVSSAVTVQSAGDIMTLTAGAATALRGAATLKARALKEVWNIASVIPVDKVIGVPHGANGGNIGNSGGTSSGELVPEENFLGICSRELLARGCELLKRTRKGDLHWKIVSVYINRVGQVMLKMKSRHVAGTVTKKKKNVVVEVVKDIPAWAGRHLLEGGEHRRFFALKTVGRGVVEFECKNQREYDIWTKGVSRLLTIAADKKRQRQ